MRYDTDTVVTLSDTPWLPYHIVTKRGKPLIGLSMRCKSEMRFPWEIVVERQKIFTGLALQGSVCVNITILSKPNVQSKEFSPAAVDFGQSCSTELACPPTPLTARSTSIGVSFIFLTHQIDLAFCHFEDALRQWLSCLARELAMQQGGRHITWHRSTRLQHAEDTPGYSLRCWTLNLLRWRPQSPGSCTAHCTACCTNMYYSP